MPSIYRRLLHREKAFVWVAIIAALVGLTSWVHDTAGIVAAAQVGAAAGTLITAILIRGPRVEAGWELGE
jgi:hypothetical protein